MGPLFRALTALDAFGRGDDFTLPPHRRHRSDTFIRTDALVLLTLTIWRGLRMRPSRRVRRVAAAVELEGRRAKLSNMPTSFHPSLYKLTLILQRQSPPRPPQMTMLQPSSSSPSPTLQAQTHPHRPQSSAPTSSMQRVLESSNESAYCLREPDRTSRQEEILTRLS